MKTIVTLVMALLMMACVPVERDYAEGLDEASYPDFPTLAKQTVVPVPAGLKPGNFVCGDACALNQIGECNDLAAECGLDCGVVASVDRVIEDPCAGYGLELVVTSPGVTMGSDCYPALWLADVGVCMGRYAGYCCTDDGWPIAGE